MLLLEELVKRNNSLLYRHLHINYVGVFFNVVYSLVQALSNIDDKLYYDCDLARV